MTNRQAIQTVLAAMVAIGLLEVVPSAAYAAGDLDFLSLMEAEKNIEGIHRDYARVLVRYQQALSTLRRVVGGKVQ